MVTGTFMYLLTGHITRICPKLQIIKFWNSNISSINAQKLWHHLLKWTFQTFVTLLHITIISANCPGYLSRLKKPKICSSLVYCTPRNLKFTTSCLVVESYLPKTNHDAKYIMQTFKWFFKVLSAIPACLSSHCIQFSRTLKHRNTGKSPTDLLLKETATWNICPDFMFKIESTHKFWNAFVVSGSRNPLLNTPTLRRGMMEKVVFFLSGRCHSFLPLLSPANLTLSSLFASRFADI